MRVEILGKNETSQPVGIENIFTEPEEEITPPSLPTP